MIVKIWPIKGDVGAGQCLLYIEDDKKVTKIEADENGRVAKRTVINTVEEFDENPDRFFIENEENIGRVFDYMANEDKTNGIYVSGYRCDPKRAMDDFRSTWDAYNLNDGILQEPAKDETMAFHLVQSFPEDLNISDEEVHQCGLELLQKMKDYQGVVCSHVHPVVDEEGEVHGRCKHNHILINAYKDLSEIDRENTRSRKYNDCKETYELLQFWNDEIAIDHGLPIIINPDLEKVYSWSESAKIKQGQSWKERVRWDVEAARRATSNWDEFVFYMNEEGYQIRDGGKHLSYTTPKGDKIRAERLGRTFMKENLELYWVLRDKTEGDLAQAEKDNAAPPLAHLGLAESGPLTVDIPLGAHDKNGERRYYTLPLVKADRPRSVLNTYFFGNELYDIKNADGKVVRTANGQEIVDYLVALQREGPERFTEEEKAEQARRQAEAKAEEAEEKQAYEERTRSKRYYVSSFRNSRTGRYYHSDLYDENGRRRTALDLLFLLAIVIIRHESGLWDPKNIPPGKENEAVFGPPDWKTENMLASLHYATEEGLSNPLEVDNRINEVGASYSRIRADVKRSTAALEHMKPLADAVADWRETKELAEKILALPAGPERQKLLEQYESELAKYKKAKAAMYAGKLNTNREIGDFLARYEEIRRKMPEKEAKLEDTKEEYRKLKKLQYNILLAQNEQYVYGPAYVPNRAANRGDLGRQVDEKEFNGDR